MIISASRRTDIPAFYSEWFVNRIRAGYCAVPNPFNRNQVSYVSLKPVDVEVIVFWTRNPRPLIPYLKELTERGFHYYFQFTVMNNPRPIDPRSPSLEVSLRAFCELSDNVGPDKVFWRYDPILFSTVTPAEFHHREYRHISLALRGYTFRSVISIVDLYSKAKKRIRELSEHNIEIVECDQGSFDNLMHNLVSVADENGMEIISCAEETDLESYGIRPGKCIDDEYIARTFGIKVTGKKDPSQRKTCGCVVSKDIGMYDSCLFGCRYCYATTSFKLAQANHENHDPNSPSLIGWYDSQPEFDPHKQMTFLD